MAGVSRPAKAFTPKQGQYLAFIHLYTRLHRRPPAEADMQQYFRVSPPSVHQMVLTLERQGFIKRQPRVPRSIELLANPQTPARAVLTSRIQSVKITVSRY
jgi:Mn-dependent DtxR family transcriptional regulator